MFCQKCWHEFRDNGPSCIYCGASRPIDEWELDWKEAAQLEEDRAQATRALSPRLRSGDGSVRPDNEARYCGACGRELPPDTHDVFCIDCLASKERKKVKVQKRQDDAEKHRLDALATHARDACRTTDDFIDPDDPPHRCDTCGKDLPANMRASTCAVCAARTISQHNAPNPGLEDNAPTTISAAHKPAAPPPLGSRFKKWCVGLVVFLIFSNIIFPIIGRLTSLIFSVASPSPKSPTTSIVELDNFSDFDASSVSIIEGDSADSFEENHATDEENDYFYFYDDIERSAPENANTREIYTSYLLVATDSLLSSMIPSWSEIIREDDAPLAFNEMQTDFSQMEQSDGLWYLTGDALCTNTETGEELSVPFRVGYLLVDNAYDIPYLALGDDLIWDIRT